MSHALDSLFVNFPFLQTKHSGIHTTKLAKLVTDYYSESLTHIVQLTLSPA
jgi:hypothetical protein